MKKSELRQLIREEIEALSEITTLGVSGMKSFAKKYGYSLKSKKSGGRVPYITLTKGEKSYGPFDPSVTTKEFLRKKLNITESRKIRPSAEIIKKHINTFKVSDDPFEVAVAIGKIYGWSDLEVEKAETILRKKYLK